MSAGNVTRDRTGRDPTLGEGEETAGGSSGPGHWKVSWVGGAKDLDLYPKATGTYWELSLGKCPAYIFDLGKLPVIR